MLVRLILCLLALLSVVHSEESFSERLIISTLASKNILYEFRFITTANDSDIDLIPFLIQDIFQRYELQELHFTMTQGFWRTSEWGFEPQNESPSGPGAMLLVGFKPDASNIDEKWNALVNLLNGIFCTSILQMTPILTSEPKFTWECPSNSVWRYGALGGEPVCTENLKSWKQMLPCKNTGLSTLLNPKELYGANYHSMGIHVKHYVNADWQFELTANLVKDLNLRTSNMDWSFSRDLGSILSSTCAIANSSQIVVERNNKFELVPSSNRTYKWKNRVFSVYDTKKYTENQSFNLKANYLNSRLELDVNYPSLYSLHTYLLSYDQQGGKIANRIVNRDIRSRKAAFTHMVPWYLRVYLHTLTFTCNGENRKANDQKYSLSVDRQKPLLIELELEIPSNSICEITYDYEAAFLRLTEYPPDSNNGLFVPGPIFTLPLDEDTYCQNASIPYPKKKTLVVHGEPLLVLLPVPDFSMPFNVICFVCTAIALFYGPAHALTTKIMIPTTDEKNLAEYGLIRRLFFRLKERIISRFGKPKKE